MEAKICTLESGAKSGELSIFNANCNQLHIYFVTEKKDHEKNYYYFLFIIIIDDSL